jgi:hypothetical protein
MTVKVATPQVVKQRVLLPVWLRFPATVFAAICMLVLLFEVLFSGSRAPSLWTMSVPNGLGRTLIDLVPPFLVCGLVALANLCLRKRHSR